MGFFIISIILFIVGGKILHDDSDKVEFGILPFALGILGMIISVILASNEPDVNRFKRDYECICEQIDILNHNDINMQDHIHYISRLDNKIADINSTIYRNKKYYNSIWFGWYNSEEIAKYKPLTLKKKKK